MKPRPREAYAAEAQYRLGQCLLKQKKNDEADGSIQKTDRIIPRSKGMGRQGQKARARPAELKFDKAPWKDGEFMQMVGKLGGGMKIGTFVFEVESAKLDGRDIWKTKNHTFITVVGDIRSCSQVYFDKNYMPSN